MGGGIAAASERISDAQKAEDIRAAADDGKQAVCTAVKHKQKTVAASKLFDLTALQSEADKLLGFMDKHTFDVALIFYEKKLLTSLALCTDSRFLTSDMEEGVATLVQTADTLIGFDGTFAVNAAQR
jgi:DNA topoisomerase-3